MQSDWHELTLGEFVRLQRGHDLTASEQRPGQFPVMGSAGANGTHSEFKAPGPGVVIGRSGASMGRVHYCDEDYWPHNTCMYVTDFLGNNPLFVYYKLAELDLARYNSGSAQPSLNRNYIYGMSLRVPIRPLQDKIANTVHSVEKRIGLNRRINETLEAMTQAIFKSWFVDFDPVKAKIAAIAEGRDPLRAAMSAISGKVDAELNALPPKQYEQLAATAALIPDEMEESKLGAVPKGWGVNTLGGVTDYLNRGISPKYLETGGMLVLNQKCIRDFRVDLSKGRRHDSNQKRIDGRTLERGDVLVNSTGVGTLGRVAQVLHLSETTIVDSHVTVVRAGRRINASYLGQYLRWKQPDIEAMGEGSTGQTELSKSKLSDLPILTPMSEILTAFDSLVSPLQTEISIKERESVMLAELRDTILPKLLSGELSVEALVEPAGAA